MPLLLPDDAEGDLRDMLRWWRSPEGQRLRTGETVDEQEPIQVLNTESSTIPAFGCMEVVGTTTSGGERKLITVKKPTSTGTVFLFNNRYPIEGNAPGVAQSGDVIRAYKSTGTVTFGNRWRPTASQYYLTKGVGNYVVLGSDDIGTDVIRFDSILRSESTVSRSRLLVWYAKEGK